MIWIIVFGMVAVTFLPRLLPFLYKSKKPLPSPLRRFLQALPFAALGALLFPDSLLVMVDHPMGGIVTLAIAAMLAFFTENILLTFLLGTGAAWLWSSLF